MTHLRSTLLAFLLLGGIAATPALAIDTIQSKDAPDLTAVRAKIKAKDWKGAAADLNGMVDNGVQHADVFNLLGFSLRNQGDMKSAQTYYAKALDYDPEHKGALEYQGEMFVKLGQFDKAQANLTKLVKLCPQGCEEREDLEDAIKTKVVKEH
jgi:tetratricopeptide (TPR) repeat protein